MSDRSVEVLAGAGSKSSAAPTVARTTLRLVALPTEHGGWSLTFEPALLGLLVAPSWAGVALAVAAFVAFAARTPIKWVLVDGWRRRRLQRTVLAEQVAAIELCAFAALVATAAAMSQGEFWLPLVIALPLVATELWFDMRSRSRRLLPELAGAIGIASVVAAIVLADGQSAMLAIALWGLLAARAIASISFVRVQLRRRKHQTFRLAVSDIAQGVATAVAMLAMLLDPRLLVGFAAFLLLVGFQLGAVRRAPPPAAVLGSVQGALGLALVAVAALGVIA
jgi:hypothetical protein